MARTQLNKTGQEQQKVVKINAVNKKQLEDFLQLIRSIMFLCCLPDGSLQAVFVFVFVFVSVG